MALVLDTGVVVALLDAGDREHARCVALAERTHEPLVVPAATLVEVDYWVRKRLSTDAWRIFVEDIARGAYLLDATDERDLSRAAELEEQYDDLKLGFVDASVIAVCERLGEKKVATLDRRHFSIVEPRHVKRLEILPT